MARLRSLSSRVETYVQFVNKTGRHINVYWVDYQGGNRLQFIMEPSDSRVIKTYLTHPWFFRDHFTGEFMQVAHRNIFLPQLHSIPDPQDPNRRIPCRKQVIIHFPMYPLRIACLYSLVSLIKDNENVYRDIESLEIPRTLHFDLKDLSRRQKIWQRQH